jgi:predicted acetyltransferase
VIRRSPFVDEDVIVLGEDGHRAAANLFRAAVHTGPVSDDQWQRVDGAYPAGRVLGVRDGEDLVGTVLSRPTRTTVPGGASLATAASTRAGVRADRTRRGILTAMMNTLLRHCADRGEALVLGRPTEAAIYGRYGYGVATRARNITIRRSGRGWRPDAPTSGHVRMVEPDDTVPVLASLYRDTGLARPGRVERWPEWWYQTVGVRVARREPTIAIVHSGPDGDDGYAFAVVKTTAGDAGWGPPKPELVVKDLHAADPAATAALWRFLLEVDFTAGVEASLRPLDEPLELLLADPRDCTVTGAGDDVWLRVVDVPTALAARTYGEHCDSVRLRVHDPLLPSNSGVYVIGSAGATRDGGRDGAADLECGVEALAMAYFGDRKPSDLAATGWWRAFTPEALLRADVLFAADSVPWCGTPF